jgi:para-aminobenzoate synthetase / 4-amino-4-deoxychorismate lyase
VDLRTGITGTPSFRLLESLRWEPGRGYFLLAEHLARMAGSACHFGFVFEPAAVGGSLRDAAAGLADAAKVRLLLDAAGRVETDPQPLPPSAGPVRVRLSPDPVDSGEPLLYHKTTRREAYDTRLAACPGCDDVLLVNERGEITESTIANLVVRMDGGMWTPPLRCGLLPGVFREVLLRGGVVRERVVRPADLFRADAVYLINSVRKWRQAVLLP